MSSDPWDIVLLGQHIRVMSPGQGLREELDACFDRRSIAPRSVGPPDVELDVLPDARAAGWRVHSVSGSGGGPEPPSVFASPIELFHWMSAWAAERTTTHCPLHAGAIACSGVGVLLVARSYHGKSTLTAAMVRRGAELLSDELAALELQSGEIESYPRQMFLRADVLATLGPHQRNGHALDGGRARAFSAESLGSRRAPGRVRPSVLLGTWYAPGRPLRLEPLRPMDAFHLLMSSTPVRPREAGFSLLAQLSTRLRAYTLHYDSLDQAAETIERLAAAATGEDP